MGNVIGIQFSCDQVISGCCNCFGKYGTYVHNLKENVEALQTALQRLQELRDDVTTRVRVCENNGLQPLATVEGWLRRVEVKENQVINLLIPKTQEIGRLYVNGYCSKNCISSYKYGRRVVKKLIEVKDLTGEGAFPEVGQEGPRPIVDERPIGTTIGLDAMLDEVWRCLMEDSVCILGLYGMGGVGKTTLLILINNKFLYPPNEFDTVIWVSVSKEVQIQRIQDDIGKKLGVFDTKWKQLRQDEKAVDIFRRLKDKKFVLLLDDLWTRVDLTKIGIPVPDEKNGCKIVFNTRSLDVCRRMEANRTIRVECLEWNHAWDLFQRKVGINTKESDTEIVECAKSIARRCRGLPLALTTVGLSLSSKSTVKEWRRAVDDLSNSLTRFEDMEDADHAILPLLKFSFDVIKDKKVQSSFLYCALLPEDYAIEKDELVDYWLGEGILDGYENRNKAEERGYEIIGNLVHACLLIEEEKKHVKMHDMIRQMALWIASDCKRNIDYSIIWTHDRANEIIEVKKRKAVKRMALMNPKVTGITSSSFPNLLSLIVRGNIFSHISDGFFKSLPRLKVLDLSQNQDLDALPREISELVSLQYLNLSWTRVSELPESFSELVNLKYLNLENAYQCKEISVVSRLRNLQTLRLYNCGFRLYDCGFSPEGQESKPSVEGLAGLMHLKVLTICVIHADVLKRLLNYYELANSVRLLSLQRFDSDSLEISSLTTMSGLESLVIHSSNVTEIKVDPGVAPKLLRRSVIISFRNLCNVTIELCPNLQDLTWLLLARNLTHLTLSELQSMEEVIKESKIDSVFVEQPYAAPFLKLKNLTLMSMQKLKSINESPLPFPCLEHITVVNCPELKKLPLNSDSTKGHKLVIQGLKEWIDNIDWEDEATKQAFILSC